MHIEGLFLYDRAMNDQENIIQGKDHRFGRISPSLPGPLSHEGREGDHGHEVSRPLWERDLERGEQRWSKPHIDPGEEEQMLSISAHELLEEGGKKGRQEGRISTLLSQLEYRFGVIPEWVNTKLHEADATALERWDKKLFDANSVEAVFQ